LAVKASEEKIARSLEGNWREALLFVLQQEQVGPPIAIKAMAAKLARLQLDIAPFEEE
jgi:hypothetical protein